MNAIWKYYTDVTIFNLGFSAIVGLFFGFIWGLAMIPSFGGFIGLICFSYFKEKEYYFYHNLGYSKNYLMLSIWVANLLISLPLLGGYLLIIN